MLLCELPGALLEKRKLFVRIPRFKVEIRDDLKQFNSIRRYIELYFFCEENESMSVGRNLIEFLYKNGFKKLFNREMPEKECISAIALLEKVICHLPVPTRRLDPIFYFFFLGHVLRFTRPI